MPLLTDKGPSYASNYIWHPPGHLYTTIVAYKIFGFSVNITRGVSLVFYILALCLLYLVGRKLGGSNLIGLLAAFFLFSNLLWAWQARSGRMDPAAFSFGLLAVLVCISKMPDAQLSLGRALAAGALIGIGSMYHVLVLIWAPALGFAYLVSQKGRGLRPLIFLNLVAGIAPLLWLTWIFNTGQDAAFGEQFVQYQLLQRKAHSPLILRPWEEFTLFLVHFRQAPFVALAFATGVGFWLFDKRTQSWMWLASGAACTLLIVTFVLGKGTGVYPLYWYTWLAIPAAIGMMQGLPRHRSLQIILMLAIANCAGHYAFSHGLAYYQREARSQERLSAFFTQNIEPHSVVLGIEELWYGVCSADSELRIWTRPDPNKHRYFVTPLGHLKEAPAGYHLKASLPDIMPRVFGRTGSYSNLAYDLWESNVPAPTSTMGLVNPAKD